LGPHHVPDRPSALERTLTDLRLADYRLVAGEPTGPHWFGLDRVIADESLIAGWLTALLAGHAQRRVDVAGAFLASYLGAVLAEPVAAAVLDHGRGWLLHPPGLALQRRAMDGWFSGLAIRGGPVLVLPGDPLEGYPDATALPDLDALRSRVAESLVGALRPVFEVIRGRTRLGWPVLWGQVGDLVVGAAVDRARQRGGSTTAAWDSARQLIDALAVHAPQVRTRQVLDSVDWSGGRSEFAVRGTCCLYYQVADLPLDRTGARADEAYCARCPLLDPTDRQRRWSAWLAANPPRGPHQPG